MKSDLQLPERHNRVATLRRARDKSILLRLSAVAAVALCVWAWLAGDLYESILTSEQRWKNLERFLTRITPAPVRAADDWSEARPWISEMLTTGKGLKAAGITFALATVAAALSGLLALLVLPAASRNLSVDHPMGIANGRSTHRGMWRLLNGGTRTLFVFTRSLPDYILGFLIISVLGPDPWSLVLALAIHNFGILGRLGSEVVENAPPDPARVNIAQGGGRISCYLQAILPESFNRLVIYFFYRWETCVREATVLGMLGVISLGFMITQAKAGRAFDKMLFYVLLGAAIVLLGDLLSILVRRWLRAS